MGNNLYRNGNGPYSHRNKFPLADAVFSCSSGSRYDDCAFDDISAFDDNSLLLGNLVSK